MVSEAATVPAHMGLIFWSGRQTLRKHLENIQLLFSFFPNYYSLSLADGGGEDTIKEPMNHYYVERSLMDLFRHQML